MSGRAPGQGGSNVNGAGQHSAEGGSTSSDDEGDAVEAGAVGAVVAGDAAAGMARGDEAVAEGSMSASDGAAPSAWPDDAAESAFLAEARERGETVAPAKGREEVAEEADPKALPPLNELVEKIPAEVRETLEELFRARFTTVKRVPKKALKS